MNDLDNFEKFINGVNPWWFDPKYRFDVIDRDHYLNVIQSNPKRLIEMLIGARRVGKTSILQALINRYLDKYDPQKIMYIPADLKEVGERGIKTVIEAILGEHNIDVFRDDIFVFVDEIQEVSKWQEDIKALYDNTKIHFFLTGSSSLLLKKETSKLTGRFLLTNVLPLSFSEYINFNKDSTKNENELLEDYLIFGGYPEYVLNNNPVYLQQAVESTLYRELLDHYGIRNPALLTMLIRFLADKMTTPVSANKISQDLKIDDKTAKFYLDYLESVYLIYPVYRYGLSHKISKSSVPKYYFNDTGILGVFGIRPRIGHLVENAVFLNLLRWNMQSEIPQIFYDVIGNQEIDFRYQNDYYEAKNYQDDLTADLNKYEDIDKQLNVIINGLSNKTKDLPYFSNLKYISLIDFLK